MGPDSSSFSILLMVLEPVLNKFGTKTVSELVLKTFGHKKVSEPVSKQIGYTSKKSLNRFEKTFGTDKKSCNQTNLVLVS